MLLIILKLSSILHVYVFWSLLYIILILVLFLWATCKRSNSDVCLPLLPDDDSIQYIEDSEPGHVINDVLRSEQQKQTQGATKLSNQSNKKQQKLCVLASSSILYIFYLICSFHVCLHFA